VADESDIKRSRKLHLALSNPVLVEMISVCTLVPALHMHSNGSMEFKLMLPQRRNTARIPTGDYCGAYGKVAMACVSLPKVTVSVPASAPHRRALKTQKKTIRDVKSRHHPVL